VNNVTWLWITGKNSKNKKTGKIPTAFPADMTQAWNSCEGCILREGKRHIGTSDVLEPQCYFWYRLGSIGNKMIIDKWLTGKRYDLEYALNQRWKGAKAVRMSGGGDPSSTPPEEYFAMEGHVRRKGLAWLDYTHFWATRGHWLRLSAMASCDSWGEALRAVKGGWRATVHVASLKKPQGKYRGVRYTLCPAQRPVKAGKKQVTCNDCRLCDASKSAVPIIVFLNH
jgi:hypothetical protein